MSLRLVVLYKLRSVKKRLRALLGEAVKLKCFLKLENTGSTGLRCAEAFIFRQQRGGKGRLKAFASDCSFHSLLPYAMKSQKVGCISNEL